MLLFIFPDGLVSLPDLENTPQKRRRIEMDSPTKQVIGLSKTEQKYRCFSEENNSFDSFQRWTSFMVLCHEFLLLNHPCRQSKRRRRHLAQLQTAVVSWTRNCSEDSLSLLRLDGYPRVICWTYYSTIFASTAFRSFLLNSGLSRFSDSG
jgi:hypothetical protein